MFFFLGVGVAEVEVSGEVAESVLAVDRGLFVALPALLDGNGQQLQADAGLLLALVEVRTDVDFEFIAALEHLVSQAVGFLLDEVEHGALGGVEGLQGDGVLRGVVVDVCAHDPAAQVVLGDAEAPREHVGDLACDAMLSVFVVRRGWEDHRDGAAIKHGADAVFLAVDEDGVRGEPGCVGAVGRGHSCKRGVSLVLLLDLLTGKLRKNSCASSPFYVAPSRCGACMFSWDWFLIFFIFFFFFFFCFLWFLYLPHEAHFSRGL